LKNGKSDALGREVLRIILSKAPSLVSWEGVAQETSIKSPPTVASYVELFERLFVVLPLYAVNPDRGTREFAKNKKLHLLDPLLWHLCEEWCMQRMERKTEVIAESVLASHIARLLSRKQGGKRLNDHVSYWKNGYEIDVVAHTRHGLVGFEMKWSDRESAFPFRAGSIKSLRYISKNFFREKKPEVIPLALFLAML
jgi:predicted AAA+ superfamily ATPase